MTGTFDAEHTARLLLDARRTMKPIATTAFPAPPRSHADAFAVQRAVMAELGKVGAFKTFWPGAGAAPVFSPIPMTGVRRSPARFTGAELNVIAVELEIAFLVEKALPDVNDPDFAKKARDCVVPLPAIEVVDTRLADHATADPLWKLTDNQLNAGLVVGEPIANWHGLELEHVTVSFIAGDKTLASGAGRVPGGNAFDIFCEFAKAVGDHCGGVKVGHYVTTGSTVGLIFIEKGRKVTGEIGGLGRVEVDIGA